MTIEIMRALDGVSPVAGEEALRERLDLGRALEAYRYFYPTVSLDAVLRGIRVAGAEDNRSVVLVDWGTHHAGFTGSSDAPHAFAPLDLRKAGPMVCEIPRGNYAGWLNDHDHRWIQDVGVPGPDAGRGGKYLLLPPDYPGERPEGYFVARSATYKVWLACQALPAERDPAPVNRLRALNVYPLEQAANPPRAEFIDATARPIDTSCLRWEDNLSFWQALRDIIDDEPGRAEDRVMYGLLAALGIAKGRQFAPDLRMRGILQEAARVGREQLLSAVFASRRTDRLGWPDRRWEWPALRHENGAFERHGIPDLEARERWFAQAVGASPGLFQRAAGAGTLAWLCARDAHGELLDGRTSYRLLLPQPVPARGGWSLTIYDAQTRSQVQTDQGRAALRFPPDETTGEAPLQLNVGSTGPGAEHFIKTRPGKRWFAYLRLHGPLQPALDGRWRPGDLEPTT
jgi:hypothetical protein